MQITEALQNLGLNEKEARVYVALLKLGRGSAYVVADEAGLKKPTTYVILGELMQKGLVNKIPRMRKKLFAAKPPDEFFAEAEERLRLAKGVLPQLTAMLEKPEKNFTTLYYEGERGVRQMLGQVTKRMRGKEVLGFYAREPESLSVEMREFFHQWNEECKEAGIKVRGITPDDPSLAWYKERTRYFGYQLKFLDPEEYSSDCSIEIGDGYVQVFSLRYLQGIHIENPDVAATLRRIFEMVWQSRPEQAQGAVEHAGEK